MKNPVWWVLVLGAAIRVALWWATPWTLTNDNHFPPVQVLLTEGRIPRPDECWVCYHPPLYSLVSAGAYWVTDRVLRFGSADVRMRYDAGRKTIQFLSVIAGALTLVVCARILARFDALSPYARAIGLAFIAFLPRHVFMSAMNTNDALAYLCQSAAILAAINLHRRGWRMRDSIVCGACIGLSLLTKGYGLFTFAAIGLWIIGCLVIAFSIREPKGEFTRRIFASGLAVFLTGAVVGAYPFVRDYRLYGRWHVDNYELHDSKMGMLPPASLQETHFLTFQVGELFERPWAHLRYVDSFWTVVFAGYWFDVLGNQNTLKLCYAWEYRKQRLQHQYPDGGQPFGRALQDYELIDVPGALVPLARAAYAVGLVAAIWLAVGLVIMVSAARRDPAATLLLIHFVLCLSIVVAQSMRQSGMTTMKSEFTLGMVSSLALAAALAARNCDRSRRAWFRVPAIVLVTGLLVINGWFTVLESSAVREATFLVPWKVPAVFSGH